MAISTKKLQKSDKIADKKVKKWIGERFDRVI
jgi:hypothetical protein